MEFSNSLENEKGLVADFDLFRNNPEVGGEQVS
jgi:hypothetical protein